MPRPKPVTLYNGTGTQNCCDCEWRAPWHACRATNAAPRVNRSSELDAHDARVDTHLQRDAVWVVVDDHHLLQRPIKRGQVLYVLSVDVPRTLPEHPVADVLPKRVHLGDPLVVVVVERPGIGRRRGGGEIGGLWIRPANGGGR